MSTLVTKMVGFEASGRRFLIDVAEVREVVASSEPEPWDPAGPLDGWITVRGEPVPVTDLRRRLGREEASSGAATGAGADASRGAAEDETIAAPVLILEHPAAGVIGVRVDRVGEVRETSDAALTPVPSYFGEPDAWIRGLLPDGDGFAVLVHGTELLTADQARDLAGR